MSPNNQNYQPLSYIKCLSAFMRDESKVKYHYVTCSFIVCDGFQVQYSANPNICYYTYITCLGRINNKVTLILETHTTALTCCAVCHHMCVTTDWFLSGCGDTWVSSHLKGSVGLGPNACRKKTRGKYISIQFFPHIMYIYYSHSILYFVLNKLYTYKFYIHL